MKKNVLVIALLAVAAWILLPACGSNADTNPTLQAPVTTQTEAPADAANATPAAMPADSTAQPETPAEAKGKDSDDDDDDRK